MPETSGWVVETTAETFDREVIERSRKVPVVVDFWATWCQPCRMLTPVLEKLAEEYAGRFVLAKAETERLPQIAAAFGVQGIPAVFGVRDESVVDSFVGVLPEEQLRAWLDRLLPNEAELLAAEADKLAADDPAAAEKKYREALALSPDDAIIKTALARGLVARGQAEEADAMVQELADRGFMEPEAEALAAELSLHKRAETAGDVDACRAAVQQSPKDLPLRLKLAQALIGAEQYEEALALCLELVQQDRHGVGEQARKVMVDVFQALGRDVPFITEYQRKLSSALY